jgi:hypothetical protein
MKGQFKSNPLINKHILDSDGNGDQYHSNKLESHHNELENSPNGKATHKCIKSNTTRKSASNSVGKATKTLTNNPKAKVVSHFGAESTEGTSYDRTTLRNKKQSNSIVKEPTCGNVVTTNFTENGKEGVIDNSETNINENNRNYASNKDVVNISDQAAETENILSHIVQLKYLFKSNEINMTKLMKSEENQKQLNMLNHMLNSVNPVNQVSSSTTSDKKINVINSNMLSCDFTNNPIAAAISHGSTNKPEKQEKKINNEIYTNSDLRIKRYGILLDFINSNLKEINDIVSNRNPDTSRDLYKIDEVQSNKLSSLHSRINLNSRTNIIIDKDNIYDYEDSEMHEFPVANTGRHKAQTQRELVNINLPLRNNDISRSILISSINSEFYQDLVDGSFANMQSFFTANISDMSNLKGEKYKLDRHFNDLDQTQLLYKRSIVIPAGDRYIEGEENIESDSDRTKENIHELYRVPRYNQAIKDIGNKTPSILSQPKSEAQISTKGDVVSGLIMLGEL